MMASKSMTESLIQHPQWTEPLVKSALKGFQTYHKTSLALFLDQNFHDFDHPLTLTVIEFILDQGMRSYTEDTKKALLEIGLKILDLNGQALTDPIFDLLQENHQHVNQDIRNAAVVMLGFLAKFFQPGDSRIESTIDLLLTALDIGSDSLASSVAKCLPKLVSWRPELGESYIQDLIHKIFSEACLQEKKGAAYGLGAVVKGVGVKSLVNTGVFQKIADIINSGKKGNYQDKFGVLLVVEGVSYVLGRAFEPYLGEILSFVIECFSQKDLNQQASASARSLIQKLSAYGMKRILPDLTHGLQQTKWKSKIGAIQVLGKMAFCSPKQLSKCLPEIVPQVIKAFYDTNPQVLASAKRAVSDIGSVITSPEIFQTLPLLTKALSDSRALGQCFTTLLQIRFYHFIDPPSLSLLVPLIESGLKARDVELKRQASQLLGGICKLLRNTQEIRPYIPRLVKAVKISLYDSIPEVRNIAAQNFAGFVDALQEKDREKLVEKLEKNLEKDLGSLQRAGSVHSYSEYLLRGEKWIDRLNFLLQKCLDQSAVVRQSYIGVFIYIPTQSPRFIQKIQQTIPVFLQNLSYQKENVRKLAVRVLQLIIDQYFDTCMNSILQPLQEGLFSVNWRTRTSCITLMGQMLQRLQSLARREGRPIVSQDYKNKILSGVYILRSDKNLEIHIQSVHIWKNLVENTPKYLMEITAQLVLKLIQISDSPQESIRAIATAAITGLIQKYQNKVFQSYINHFLDHFETYPKGVAFALRTVCEQASKGLLILYHQTIVQILARLLSSDDPDYLNNAGGIFHDLYQKTIADNRPQKGVVALLDNVVAYPKACKQLLSFKNYGITKLLVPRIMKSPYKVECLKTLGGLISNELFSIPELQGVFPSVLESIRAGEALLSSAQNILASISKFQQLQTALEMIKQSLAISDTIKVVLYFCSNTELVYQAFVGNLLSLVMDGLHQDDPEVLQNFPLVLQAIMKPIPKQEHFYHYQFIHSPLCSGKPVPLFNLPKGLDSVLPLVLNSLLHGNPQIKEKAAQGFSFLITLTGQKTLEAYAVKVAGPLIRILGQRVPGYVKVKILEALFLLLQKASVKLKPFVSQLLSSFIKVLGHQEAPVRASGKRNMLELLKLNPRLDIIVKDLCTLIDAQEIVMDRLETMVEIFDKADVSTAIKQNAKAKLQSEINFTQSDRVSNFTIEIINRLEEHVQDNVNQKVFQMGSIKFVVGLLKRFV